MRICKGLYILLFSGFVDVKAACCGIGELNAELPCLPTSSVCSNRQDHIFWDLVHPTQAATQIIVDRLFNGLSKDTSPIDMEQLLAPASVSIANSFSPFNFFLLLPLAVANYQTTA